MVIKLLSTIKDPEFFNNIFFQTFLSTYFTIIIKIYLRASIAKDKNQFKNVSSSDRNNKVTINYQRSRFF